MEQKQNQSNNTTPICPDGQHTAIVRHVFFGPSKAGNSGVSWKLIVLDPATGRAYKTLTKWVKRSKAKKDLAQIGIVASDEADLNVQLLALTGQEYTIEVATESSKGEPEKPEPFRRIRFLSAGSMTCPEIPAVTPDLAMAGAFLSRLAEGGDDGEGRLTFQTFDDSGKGRTARPALCQVFHGSISDAYIQARLVSLNRKGAGIFWQVQQSSGDWRGLKSIVGIRLAYVDLDGSPLDKVFAAPLSPRFILETSPGHYHAYWPVFPFALIRDAETGKLDIDQVELVTGTLGTLADRLGGDPAVANLDRVMRVPGFYHLKDPSHPHLSRVIQDDPSSQDAPRIDELCAALGITPKDRKKHAKAHRSVFDAPPSQKGGNREIWKALREIPIDLVADKLGIGPFPGDCPTGHTSTSHTCMKLYPEAGNHYKCYSCGIWGSTIDLVGLVKACSSKEAVRYLMDTFKDSLPSDLPEKINKTEAQVRTQDRAISPALSASLAMTDLGNAERLIRYHGPSIYYCYDVESWFTWTGKNWEQASRGQIQLLAEDAISRIPREADALEGSISPKELAAAKEALRKWAEKSQSAGSLRAMIDLARAKKPIEITRFDAIPSLLNCHNGVINLKTAELLPHNPEFMLSRIIETAYSPEAVCPLWDKAIQDILVDEELINFIHTAAGYSITGETTEQCFFLAYGGGCNGKSTFLEVLKAVIAPFGHTAATDIFLVSHLEREKYGLANLRGARLVTASEIPEGKSLDEALVKSITGGEEIEARQIKERPFRFTPCCKVWLAVNNLPEIHGTDKGIWRRVKKVPFLTDFDSKPDKDKDIKLKLLSTEKEGILAWLVAGASNWYDINLPDCEIVRMETENYRQDSDMIGRFLGEMCMLNESFSCQKNALFESFRRWCEMNGERCPSSKKLSQYLARKSIKSARDGHYNVHQWLGIGLREQIN